VPVLVTAAHRPIARRIAARLLEEGGEVRAFTDADVASLRAAGAFVASGTWDDVGLLEAALAEVHTVVHVGGGIAETDPSRIVREVEVVASAATGAGVRRLIALSLPGAGPRAEDPIRRAKGEAEEVLAAIPCPTIVVRASLIDTPGLRDVLATAGLSAEQRDISVAPVRAEDLIELVLALDRARARATEGHLVVAADGPVRMTIGAYLARVGVGPPGSQALVGRRLPSPERLRALADVLGGPWWTDDPVILDGWRFADRQPAPPGHADAAGG